jgi:alkaline phosphatase
MTSARNPIPGLRLVHWIVLAWLIMQPLAAQTDFYRPPVQADQLPFVESDRGRNVILLIGDGMGVATISAARIHATGTTGKLHMDRMPVAGFVRTSAANALVTDSAAASTAMATGNKTNNGMISVSPDGRRLTTLFEQSRERKMALGLVATSSLTHATPAGFAAHVEHRSEESRIAEQLLENRVNVLLGGGQAFFMAQTEAGSRRIDALDLISQAQRRGYAFVDNRTDLLKADQDFLLGLFSLEGMLGVDSEPSLPEMTEQALTILSRNRNGFMLVIEGSQIDWANHDNDLERACRETLWFDLAVQKALDFAVRDKRTLVIVTADHGTGGMAIRAGNLDGTGLEAGWVSGSHTGETVPLYAYGPGAEKLSGFRDNTEIARVIAQVLGLKPLRQQPIRRLTATTP